MKIQSVRDLGLNQAHTPQKEPFSQGGQKLWDAVWASDLENLAPGRTNIVKKQAKLPLNSYSDPMIAVFYSPRELETKETESGLKIHFVTNLLNIPYT